MQAIPLSGVDREAISDQAILDYACDPLRVDYVQTRRPRIDPSVCDLKE